MIFDPISRHVQGDSKWIIDPSLLRANILNLEEENNADNLCNIKVRGDNKAQKPLS